MNLSTSQQRVKTERPGALPGLAHRRRRLGTTNNDGIFLRTQIIPAPATAMVGLAGLIAAGRRR